MLSLVVSTTLAFCGAQEPVSASADGTVAQLATATAEFAKAESYTFTSTSRTERPGGGEGRGGGRGRGGGGELVATTGTFKKGMPMMLVAGETTAYKNSDQLVNKNDVGAWEEFDPQSMRGGGGRGGGGERGGGGMNRALFTMMRIRAPHEVLAGFEKKQATIAHQQEGELDVFTGKLTDETAEGMGGGFGRGGFGGGEMAVEGTYRVEVMAGKVVGASFTIQRSGDFGGRAFEMTTETTLAFLKVGQTELEIPDEVLLLFGS